MNRKIFFLLSLILYMISVILLMDASIDSYSPIHFRSPVYQLTTWISIVIGFIALGSLIKALNTSSTTV